MSNSIMTTSFPHKDGSLEYWREMAQYLSGIDKKHRKIAKEFLEWLESVMKSPSEIAKFIKSNDMGSIKINTARCQAYRKFKQIFEKHGVKLEE